jgi:hypothetical protein
MASKTKTIEIERGRDAGTGKFVPLSYTDKHPKTTIKDTMHVHVPVKKK